MTSAADQFLVACVCDQTNFGTRIDFILASRHFGSSVLDADIMVSDCSLDIFVKVLMTLTLFADLQPEFMGSDHCPVWADIKVDDSMRSLMNSGPWPVPQLCSSNFPEFSGKQQTLKAFLSAVRVSASSGVPGQLQQTSRVEMQRIEVESSISSTSTVRPVITDGDGSQEQQEQKGRKQVKLWSFFAGPNGAPAQKREQSFQSAREVVERASKPKENPNPDRGSSHEIASPVQAERAPLAQLPAQLPTQAPAQPPAAQQAWKSLLGGPEKPPLCTGRKCGTSSRVNSDQRGLSF